MSGQASRGGRWMLLLLLQGAVELAISVGSESEPRVSLDNVWAASDTITITLITQNFTDHKVIVSVKRGNDSNVIILDHLPHHHHQNHTSPQKQQHTIEDLTADTQYHVCVAASQGVQGEENIMDGDCYMIRTQPQVNNVTDAFASMVAVGTFLVVVVVGWLFYKTLWAKCLSKLLPNKDKYKVDQPAGELPNTSTPQDAANS